MIIDTMGRSDLKMFTKIGLTFKLSLNRYIRLRNRLQYNTNIKLHIEG
jgi:hypothetical protein